MTTSISNSWKTSTPGPDPMKPSLVKRAKKRECYEGASPGTYVVIGNDSLGDSYPEYLVEFGGQYEGGAFCDCMSSSRQGSQYRRTCSHITTALLYIEEHGEWGESGEVDEDRLVSSKEPPTKGVTWTLPTHESFEEASEDSGGSDLAASFSPGGRSEESEAEPPESTPVTITPAPDPARKASPTDTPSSLTDGLWDISNPDLWDELEDPDFLPKPADVKVNNSDPPIPEKFQHYRESQWRAILEIDAALEEGFKAVFVSAPTGSGKTLIAESVRRLRGTRAIYTCTTKTLQNQILNEFDYAKVIKGRSNYPTLDNPQLTALDCTKAKKALPACSSCPGWKGGDSWQSGESAEVGGIEELEAFHCNWCHPWKDCPYEVAKFEAAQARLSVLNTAYFLAETNYVRKSLFRGRSLVMIDEADLLEEELMRFIEVTITAKDRKLLGVGLPEKKTVDESWVVWITEEVLPAIKAKKGTLNLTPNLFGEPEIKELRIKKKLERLAQKIRTLLTEVENEETGEKEYVLNRDWVYTGYEKDWKTGKYPPDHKVNVTFKPVQVREYAPDFLWNKGQRFVLLSATLISPAQMAYDLGLEDDEWTVVEVPSSFPVIQRPIVPRTVASITNKTMKDGTSIPMLIKEVGEILNEHPNDRVLVHSVSYRLTKEIYYELKHMGHGERLSTYFVSSDREGALNRYLQRPNGVLVAPSFDRGVDLPADDCRVVVVAKVPYLSVGDKQVSARLYGTGRAGKIWYAVQAIRTLCQMTGRGMRSAEDSCRTYILDSQFTELYNRNRKLFPQWWAEAIVWDENDPKWKDMA